MLKKFFRKNTPVPSNRPTLKQQTASMWNWFSENSAEFYQAIEEGRFSDHTESFSQKLHEFFPGLAWVFGPGPDSNGHSLTLSPEAEPYKGAAIAYIVSKAPTLPGWTFYSSRQPSDTFTSGAMEIAGQKITAKEIWITPDIDEEAEEIDVVCWAPVFKDLPEKDRLQIIFLWLDEALGELKVTHRLGSIDIHGDSLKNAMPLAELPEFVTEIETTHQWKPTILGESYASYSIKERPDFEPTFLRSDILAGTSLLHRLCTDHLNADGRLDHPLPDWGVDYIFISLPREIFTPKKEIEERGELEDAIENRFNANDSGRILGVASGIQHLYIDIAIHDGQNGVNAVLETLRNHPLGKDCEVRYFDKERIDTPLS